MSGMITELEKALCERVLVLDGAMGTMVQRYELEENDFRGKQFADWSRTLKGCNDVLCLTRPDVIADIHRQYINAGADIIETDTFNANSISMAEYGLSGYVREINVAGAQIARAETDKAQAETGRRVYVAGSIGPGNVSLSMPAAPGEEDAVDFGKMSAAYSEQARALIEGGVDIILLETIFDTLNAKAAIAGVKAAMTEMGKELPIMLSVTLTEIGRTLSGQTIEAFVASTLHAGAMSVGLNCGFGAEGMAPYLDRLQKYGKYVSLHPNAGLPDEMGQYTETPEKMAATMRRYLEAGKLNIAGGCCGTTPEHIRAIAEIAKEVEPRRVPADVPDLDPDVMLLAGLEAEEVSPAIGFVKVGERCNVAGSKKFLRLINEGSYTEALEIAAGQITKGAGVLDINMDDGMLDARAEMSRFVEMLGLDGSTASAPLMIDSSRMEVILDALCRIQGRPIVNSISLKEGEDKFLDHARAIRSLGGAVVVMAFDEQGQATTFERRVEICSRAYRLLTEKAGLRGCDIIFDPNILTIATGIPEHDRYALDFLEAVSWIKAHLPGAKVSGGVSNLSFAFRGNNPLREAMHTVFLHHAIASGMDMAIVNPATMTDISTVDPTLREAIEDVIFCRHEDAAFRLLEIASAMKEEQERRKAAAAGTCASTTQKKATAPDAPMSLAEMVMKGVSSHLKERLEEALHEDGSAMAVIKGRLMEGMNSVGEAFGAGRMFLPQVVRSAGVMKQAIAWLTPYIEAEQAIDKAGGAGRMVLATVKGDVHDIGKNIVAVVMRCSGFDVIDMGVMVDAEKIIAKAKETKADFIGLSGLITPSLSEMAHVASMMEREGMIDVPLFVGGATTSDLHTAVKIAPEFSGLTIHTRDAATMPDIAAALTDPSRRQEMAASVRDAQQRLRDEYEAGRRSGAKSVESASPVNEPTTSSKVSTPSPRPLRYGVECYSFALSELSPLINWKAFYHVWKVPADAESERDRLRRDAEALIVRLESEGLRIDARVMMAEAHREGDDIVASLEGERVVIPTLRREAAPYLAMADFLAEKDDTLGLFAVTVGRRVGEMIRAAAKNDDYEALMLQSVADRLVEAATEKMHTLVHENLWNISDRPRGIRPAIGYPSLPDQSLVFEVDRLLHYADMGIELTENGALWPSATTTGLIFASSEARYFEIGAISEEQMVSYADRRGLPLDRVRSLLPRH